MYRKAPRSFSRGAVYLPGILGWNHKVSSFPASAVASLERLETHNELSEKVTPMYWFGSDTAPTVKETTPPIFLPKSYAVAASSLNMALPEEFVKLSGLLTEPLELWTEIGINVREGGARMYSAYGIAHALEAKLNRGNM